MSSNLQKAFDFCKKEIKKRKLKMELTNVDYDPDERKLTFYFNAPKRVDFRELVKVLKEKFKVKIELHQRGARDEAKAIGGYGPCGEEVCCARFLGKFESITLDMARGQGLKDNPQRWTGLCGKLKCCLMYEYCPHGEEDFTKCEKCKKGAKNSAFQRFAPGFLKKEKRKREE